MLYLDVARNDPDNGLFAFVAPMLQIGEAEFECLRSPPRFVEGLDGGPDGADGERTDFRLAGRRWAYSWSKDWVGNWCWNRYALAHPKMTPRWAMTDFVIWLRRRKLYSCVCAPSDFYAWFNGADWLPPARVHELVCELEAR